MQILGVECNADRYFFGKLFQNKNLIRKEKNDIEVIKSITQRSKGNFCLGIVDIDKRTKIPKDFHNIYEDKNNQIYKHISNAQFLILIGPRQFEHWINDFLKIHYKEVTDFGFETFDSFMKVSKTINPENDSRFKEIIEFVIQNYNSNDNHIFKLKRRVEYI